MGSAISLEQYLRTGFESRDREFVNGVVVEMGLSDEPHSRIQWRLSGLIWDIRKELPFSGCISPRLRVRPTRIRIPDVCVFAGGPASRVRHIWLVDPESLKLKVYADGVLTEVSALTIPEHSVELSAAQIFG